MLLFIESLGYFTVYKRELCSDKLIIILNWRRNNEKNHCISCDINYDYGDSKNPEDWNKAPTEASDKQATYYKALVVAGPSAKGKELATKINSEKN